MNSDPQAAQHQVPGPAARFDIGDTDDSLERMQEYFHRYGDFFRVHAPGRGTDTLVINDPVAIKRVLVSNHRNYTKGVGINRVKLLLGNGIMVSEGEHWHRQRRMMQPFFHRRAMDRYHSVMVSCTKVLLDRWQAAATRRATVNLTADLSWVTLEIMLRTIFGEDLARLQQDLGGNPFAVVAEESARDLRFAARFRALAQPITGLVARRRRQGVQQSDLLALLMEARDKARDQPMTDRELVDEVMTLIVAGHETTASGLNWLWYLVSQHPVVERRLHAEVDAVASAGELTLSQALSLGYVEQVVDEALRLFPPGWLLTRRAISADVLGGYPVSPGSDVFICPYILHRHPRYWDHPDTFDPDRFRETRIKERNRFVYLPFAAGPRNCIGQAFALTEMTLHVAMVARRLRLQYVADQPLVMEPRVNLRTRHPIAMRVIPR